MRLMILGGSSNQIDLILKAKQEGDFVILADYDPDCEGFHYADIYLKISTFDFTGILKAAKEYHVEGIASSGTDQPVLTAAMVSEIIGLPFYIDTKTAIAVTNKRVMKRIFKENKIPSVDYALIERSFSPQELDGLTFPVVLKPVDSQGQRGVFKLNSVAEVEAHVEETLGFSKENMALVESYYPNDEITVNGWVYNGVTKIISVVDRVTIRRDQHIGICLCHHFPSVHLKTHHRQIAKMTLDIVRAFQIKNGPIYFQFLVGADGIMVNEIAMRVGGAYEGVTIPIIANTDILKMVLDSVKGKEPDMRALYLYQYLSNPTHLSTQLFFCNPGRIKSITPIEEIEQLPYVKRVYYKYKNGDQIPEIENATARAGYFIVEGSCRKEMIANVNEVFERLQIIDMSGKNLTIKYKDYQNKYLFYDESKDA